MRIYAAADIHGKPERLSLVHEVVRRSNPDILVVAGDITNYGNAISVITKINDIPVPVVAIRGNSDMPKVEKLLNTFPNTRSLHFKQHFINGICFTGIGGTIPVPFNSRICLREKNILKKLSPFVSNACVFVCHTPPRGIRDKVMGKFSAGSGNLYKFIDRNQPKVLICGHIHEGAGIGSIGNTLVVNCSISRSTAGAIIEYQKDGKLKATILKRTDTNGPVSSFLFTT